MLHDLKELIGSSVIAIDGEMGKVRNFLFDDLSWTVLYLVVDVGIWVNTALWFFRLQRSNVRIGRGGPSIFV